MRNDEEEIKRKILVALQKHQQPNFFSKKRLIFSTIASFLIVTGYGLFKLFTPQEKIESNTIKKTSAFYFPMSFCGDISAGGTNKWYRVYVNYTDSNLRRIRKYYCCDAYVNAANQIIVASFYNRSKANKFVTELKSRGFNARRGTGTVVTTTRTRNVNHCK
ncbi:hypothetical protein MC7420_3574 [Coleofasciculus chthonoplastes PCC 7420]|uniref:Sporulation and cell division repeat protein n=1 Tax=Coleofasciculus chthonoplastes PCC 7420 TaxID=118168 RepID=B4W039_9CYAN|nr:hypothetical protein [Coleofasciculus chthonoplastes]EDX72502.1 hypothetical protein MC7420_3574 [Coleofasciculus chthonoplastes PCC 7420]